MHQDCKQCQDLLWSYLAKELSDAESNFMEVHLQGCPSCQKEAEALAPVVSSLREEVPMPATFSAELHQKLTLAAEEMAAEKASFQKSFLEKLRVLPQQHVFRTLAPALICLVLVVGVFSSGLFDRWNAADQFLADPAVETPISAQPSVSEKTPEPTVIPDVPADDYVPPVKSRISNPTIIQPEQPVIATEPAPAIVTPEAASAPIVSDSAPANAEHIPAPADMIPEDSSTGYVISRHRPRVSCLTVSDAETFLNNWQESTGNVWEPHIQDVTANEILSGVDPDALVLELTSNAVDSLLDYATTSEDITEDQGETLVIITGEEE